MSKLRIITIANNKGGVGKTLLTKTLGEYAALVLGKRVLLIDLDPQTNLSRRYLKMTIMQSGGQDYVPPRHPDWQPEDKDWNGISSSADIWFTGLTTPYPTDIENLDILPAHADMLADVELVHKKEVSDKVIKRLKRFLELEEVAEAYDFVLIDTRPSKGPLTQAALTASTHLIIPTEMAAPSVEGLFGMFSLANKVNATRANDDKLQIVGILPNKVKPATVVNKQHMELLTTDPVIGPLILPIPVQNREDYSKTMYEEFGSIFAQPPSNKARAESQEVCSMIFSRIN